MATWHVYKVILEEIKTQNEHQKNHEAKKPEINQNIEKGHFFLKISQVFYFYFLKFPSF